MIMINTDSRSNQPKGRKAMNGARRARVVGALFTIGVLVACGGEQGAADGSGQAAEAAGGSQASAQVTADVRQEAQQIFSTRCAVCHGAEGRGDGPGGSALDPKPRNYHDTAWQDSVTDQEIETAIVYGGAAVGKSPAMVGNPDLGSKPAVVAALREIIRTFGKQK
jgi:mono/diheme cytochrome c family protein